MASTNAIVRLSHAHIDQQRWDACVQAAPNGLLYSLSGYLNKVCPGWQGLVYGDYEAVMPLPIKRKWGLPYAWQPWGLAQGGVSSKNGEVLTAAFIKILSRTLRYGTLDLNEADQLPTTSAGSTWLRTNLVLALDRPYNEIEAGYSDDAKKNLRRAQRHGLQASAAVPVATVAQLYKAQYSAVNAAANGEQLEALVSAGQWLLQQGLGFTIGIHASSDNELLAAALFGNYKGRLYYLLGAPTERGRQQQAVYFLLDTVVQQYAQQALVLDFEGSDIDSVAEFYQRFGPVNRPYPTLHVNSLPWPLGWLKK